MAWNIVRVFLPLILLAFLSHQAGEKIRYSKFSPGRAFGFVARGNRLARLFAADISHADKCCRSIGRVGLDYIR